MIILSTYNIYKGCPSKFLSFVITQDLVILKSACSATVASQNIEILPVANQLLEFLMDR